MNGFNSNDIDRRVSHKAQSTNENMNPVQNKTDNPDDAEEMRLAFQAFMLKGKGAASSSTSGDSITNTSAAASTNSKKKKKKKRQSTGASPHKQTPTKPEPTFSPSLSKLEQFTKKRYYQLLRSFSNKVLQSWFEVDDQMLAVLENIVSIRGRLPLEWKMLDSYDKNRGKLKGKEKYDQDWKWHGYRGTNQSETPTHLHRADVQLALNNDLEQHEKMIGALRSLISELSETHDSLGRLVDTIWAFHLERQQDLDEIEEEDEMHVLVQHASDLFQMLSTELYRKQCVISSVIATVNDEMLGLNTNADTGNTPLKLAKDYHKSWARRIDRNVLNWLMQLSSQ